MNRFLITIFISCSGAFSQDYFLNSSALSNQSNDSFTSSIDKIPLNTNILLPQQNDSSKNEPLDFYPLIYLNLYGGIGISLISSSKIESLLGDEYGIGLGLPTWSWGLIFGYKNIAQIEFNNGISDHDFNNNSIIRDVPSKVIEMDYETSDWQVKLNPLFWNMEENKAYFLIIGSGDVDWKDTNNDGFKGNSQILGLEYAQFSKYTSWSVSLKRYDITFRKTVLFNIPFDFKTTASDYILELKVGFGYGI